MIAKGIELLRAGDVFLIKYNCPHCGAEVLSGLDKLLCNNCYTPIDGIDISNVNKRNLVSLTNKTNRKRISKKIVQSLLDLQEYRCAYCSLDLKENPYDVEHILPVSAGGSNNYNNLVISCKPCNGKASNKVFTSFGDKKAYILKVRFNK